MKNKKNEKDLKTQEMQNQLVRVMADYDNLKKRVEKERADIFKFASYSIINKLLPLIDMLEEAQNHLHDQGLAIALGEFQNVLKNEGAEKIMSKIGEKFDEKIHEALEAVEGGEKGTIAESVLCGYKMDDDTMIRYEKVKVFKGKENVVESEKKRRD